MDSYRIDVVTLFPDSFSSLSQLGVIGRAFEAGIVKLHTHNPRNFTNDKYRKVDDQPYGGGAGMVLKPEPVFSAVESIPSCKRKRVLMMTPQGNSLTQKDLQRWSNDHDQLVLICGNYEGFDERIRTLANEEVSVGDFVLTGGEIPAMIIINGVVRLLPGTVGTPESLKDESHSFFLLEHPHYTRRADFRGEVVPEILRSGDHRAIEAWREKERKLRTQKRRPDLYQLWLNKEYSSTATRASSFNTASIKMSISSEYEDDDHMWI